MKRFMGMMPSSLIERTQSYTDRYGKILRIDACKEGWTVIYADGSTNYKDIYSTTDKNFKEAYRVAFSNVGPLRLRVEEDVVECCGECCGEC